ncbi:serine/threonine-protein kinase [Actinocorallia sp. A-T 12471]|uniref:serine/threonine-protein kinase n=1 Tax=Actinocorallia sp. A-T 12471 TaxID=3089813 RepID=UPI0029CF0C39|nr:serine/threonine-protein kinase [Actinocorallia sp. A-T 12471]MDX6742871.1 serine/threonine-protein kinase [Actinocorallia sp. A-T 12471]
MTQEDPQRIGPYRLLDRIGRGGMGTVYLAEDPQGVRVAVKVINAELADEASFRDRFRREVTAARSVRRFCTASVLDANLEADPLYVVTEYVDGPNLDDHIRLSGPMTGSTLEHLAVGVATALSAIHGAGIVHRDLKPGNVLLSQLGPRVIDFGIARALDTTSAATRTGTFVGTPAYMAPEVIRGEEATPAADVWAWGCVVAFAGTGVAPFAAANIPAILYQVTQGEPNLDGLDPSVLEIVRLALSRDPVQRPSALRLLELLTGQSEVDPAKVAPTIAAAAWPSGQTTRDSVPPPLAAPGALAAAPPAPGPAQAWSPMLPPPSPPPTAAPPAGSSAAKRPNRSGRQYLLVGAGTAVAAVAVGAFLVGSGKGVPDSAEHWSDDFSGTSTGWADDYNKLRAYLGGGYQMKTAQRDLVVQSLAPMKTELPARTLLSVDLKAQGSPGGKVGLVCLGPNTSQVDGYQFLIRVDGKGAVLRRVVVGQDATASTKELAVLAEDVPGFDTGEKNRVQAACEVDAKAKSVRLRLWVDGEFVLEHRDEQSPLLTGQGGLIIIQDDWDNKGVVADFDNFEVGEVRD